MQGHSGCGFVFFFKQKTAYEMRISDWSSDVCSSDLWTRGKVLGGSTSVNGLMYVRGQPADFDEIAEQTSADWSWQHIGAAYRAMECHELGSDATRRDCGPLRITMPPEKSELTEAMIAAGVSMGRAEERRVGKGGVRTL